jgi:hypothetical protein
MELNMLTLHYIDEERCDKKFMGIKIIFMRMKLYIVFKIWVY